MSSLMLNVILATYNEAENIVPMLNMICHTLNRLNIKYMIILVDDNSNDKTVEFAKDLQLNDLKIIQRKSKLGLGSAYLEALKYCIYAFTVIMDADLQHDPFTIPVMLKKIQTDDEYDIVTGTRYANHGMVCRWPFKRKLLSMISNCFARSILGLKVSDLTRSFRCYKTSFLQEIAGKVICKKFGFQMEVMARAEKMNKKIAEIPIIFYDRIKGDSKMCLNEVYNLFQTIMMLYFVI